MTKEEIRLNDEQNATIFGAIRQAILQFRKFLERRGIDSEYFPLKIEVRMLSSDFEYVLKTITFDDLEMPRRRRARK